MMSVLSSLSFRKCRASANAGRDFDGYVFHVRSPWVYGEINLRVVGIEVTLKTVLFNDTFKRNCVDGEQPGTEDGALRNTKIRSP